MVSLNVTILLFLLTFTGNNQQDIPAGYDEQLYKRAVNMAQSTIIVDGHIDVPYRLLKEFEDISKSTDKGDFDYPRAQRGGLNVPFMSIYIPAPLQKTPGKSKRHAEKLIAMMDSIIAANPDKFAKALTPEDVVDHIEHVVKIAGIDYVGLGSDFDGVGDSLPTDLKSVADYPNLVYHLLKRGYSEEDIEKILSGNVLRVWQEVVDYSVQEN
jgi:microsomal dipeptidase-like Zn-dependent dipeptidase